jgi:Spy/CpxP family protein refolding chaperone
MNRFRTLTLSAALVGVLTTGVVFAQGPAGPGRRGGPGFGGGLPLRGLNLSDAQEQQLRTLRQQYREQNRSAAEKLRTAMEAQRKAVQTIPIDEQLIRSTAQALAEAQTDMALQQARLYSDVYGLLTPEQQATARKLQAERETRAQQRQQQRQQRQQQQPRN